MKRMHWIIVWSAITAACVGGTRPPVVTPDTPDTPDNPTRAAQCADIWQQELGRAIDPDGLRGCVEQFRRGDTGEQVREGVRASDEWQDKHKPTPPAPPAPTDAELHLVRASFCNLRDASGRVIFTAFYAGLPEADRRDWLARLVVDGSTHVVLSPAAGYPGSPIPSFDLYGQPDRFAAFVREILATAGANGKALTPILILDDGASGFRDRIRRYWPGIRQALGDDAARVLVVPGWELVKASEATSADYAFALTFLHDQGWPHIWAHLSARRASAASNPIEADDPWQGAESAMWKSHGGQFVEGLLYQSEAIRPGDERCDPTRDDCWLNRWEDVVVRIPHGGPNINGWRPMHLAYFEGPAYYYYRGQSDDAFPTAAGRVALAMCRRYGATCGLGNGGAALLGGVR